MEELVHDGMESLLRILGHFFYYYLLNSDFRANERNSNNNNANASFGFSFTSNAFRLFHLRLPKVAAMYGDFRTHLHLRQI